jgi:hypothetical protein
MPQYDSIQQPLLAHAHGPTGYGSIQGGSGFQSLGGHHTPPSNVKFSSRNPLRRLAFNFLEGVPRSAWGLKFEATTAVLLAANLVCFLVYLGPSDVTRWTELGQSPSGDSAASVATEQRVRGGILNAMQVITIIVYTSEYGLRCWSIPEHTDYLEQFRGSRLRWAVNFYPLVRTLSPILTLCAC